MRQRRQADITDPHEKIRRFVFPACTQGNCAECPSYQSGYVDGLLRSAGEQCAHECHTKRREEQHNGATV